MQTYTYMFMGRPGSGKGTQAKKLAEKLDFQYLSSGDVFRSIATESSPLGKKVREEIDAGLLTEFLN